MRICGMGVYEATLNALYDGLPAVGIEPAPTSTIRTALEYEGARWEVVKAKLLVVQQNEPLADDAKAQVYRHLNDATDAAKRIAGLYAIYAQHAYN